MKHSKAIQWAIALAIVIGATFAGAGNNVTQQIVYTATAGGGLVKGGTAAAPSFGLIRTCGSTQLLKWNGSAWACAADADSGGDITSVTAGNGLSGGGSSGAVTLDVGAGTGISVGADTISVNIAGASCTGVNVMTALGATGTGTCASPPTFTSIANGYAPLSGGGTTNFLRADGAWGVPAGAGDITDVVAGNGLTDGGSSGSVTLNVACLTGLTCNADSVQIADRDFGDITTSSAGTTWTIDNATVSLAKMADLATARFIGRTTAGTGVPESLTATQATALLDSYAGSTKGLVPAGGGSTTKFFREDGAWSLVSGVTAYPALPNYGCGYNSTGDLDGVNTYWWAGAPAGNVYTLLGDVNLTNLTIRTGKELKANGYRIFVNGSLDLQGTGKIQYNGTSASGVTAGTGLGANVTGGSTAGGAVGGGTGASFSSTGINGMHDPSATGLGGASSSAGSIGNVPCRGGGGGGSGAGNTGGSSGTLSLGLNTTGGPDIPSMVMGHPEFTLTRWTSATGGGGGGGATTSGAGGGGGGYLVVSARTITGSGTIEVKGGNGGNATGTNKGGGGGGGGGVLVVTYNTNSGTVTFSAAGGTHGTGSGGGFDGGDGATGIIIATNTSGDGT